MIGYGAFVYPLPRELQRVVQAQMDDLYGNAIAGDGVPHGLGNPGGVT